MTMLSFSRLLAVFLLGLCLANSPAWADANPTAADVQRSLDTLADRKPVSYTHLTLPTTPYV